jgi:hypothetical protein
MEYVKIRLSVTVGWKRGGGGEMNANRVLVEKAKYKRSLRKPRRKWEDNSKMYFREMVCINVV